MEQRQDLKADSVQFNDLYRLFCIVAALCRSSPGPVPFSWTPDCGHWELSNSWQVCWCYFSAGRGLDS
ncbi:hypothetical protein Y1Q_0014687 [Alligator mississippiensis]|uniref:Uncharacterized protein n=1 Tax=Alligator mississippiensis TaxID=8496 RepID=A0A151P863_ALLMI|nr:hypothetical protein Y1Q_0014687 [Alligator mississippiensis]